MNKSFTTTLNRSYVKLNDDMNRSYVKSNDDINRSYVKSNDDLNRSYVKSPANINISAGEDVLNRSYVVSNDITEAESNEEFDAMEAESNEEYRVNEENRVNEGYREHRNVMNQSFTLESSSVNHESFILESHNALESHNLERFSDRVFEDLNTSFTVRKHYEETITDVNPSDINDNVVNGSQRTNLNGKVEGNLSYRTFTRPKKPVAYRNGTSGLQRRSIMKPGAGNVNSGASNLNSTFTQPPAAPGLNETVNISANARFGNSR